MSTADALSPNADDFLSHIRTIDHQYEAKFRPRLAKLRADLEAKAGKNTAPELDEALEEHRRVYIVDEFLRALNWNTGLESEAALPTLSIEQPLRSQQTGRSVRLDYLGTEAETELPLMVVETKAPRDVLPRLASGTTPATLAHVFAKGLAGAGVTGGWRKWLDRQCEYIRSVKEKTGHVPRRVLMTNGTWFVVFEDPEDAFVPAHGQARQHRLIHVFEDSDAVQTDFVTVYRLLEYWNVAATKQVISPEEIAFVVGPKVERATHGLLLLHSKKDNLRGAPSPIIEIAPLILLEIGRGNWVGVESPHAPSFPLPRSKDQLPQHLTDVHSAAKLLWQLVCSKLPRQPEVVSISDYYADAMSKHRHHGVREWGVGRYSLPTGLATHYLKRQPSVGECDYHSFGRAQADSVACSHGQVLSRSIVPRSFFVNDEPHHCAHGSVTRQKAARLTVINAQSCGPRSGLPQQAFCEIWRFEMRLCCRTCAYEEVCTVAPAFDLPCSASNESSDEI